MKARIRRLPDCTGALHLCDMPICEKGATLVQEMQTAETAGAAAPMSADEQRHLAQSIRQEMGIRPDENEAMRVNTAFAQFMTCTCCRCIQRAACSSLRTRECLCANDGLCKDFLMPDFCGFREGSMKGADLWHAWLLEVKDTRYDTHKCMHYSGKAQHRGVAAGAAGIWGRGRAGKVCPSEAP